VDGDLLAGNSRKSLLQDKKLPKVPPQVADNEINSIQDKAKLIVR
jgi:hypothetical protein